ncbi:hypothetical protein TeGR_g13401 [Tetraparma gracilis]|uniref:DNA replication complex GINS protein PSF3 n=1 Tax=Tetraparma gracilis TaxID=2962635 RepID=A0ABQ6MGG9_9STRA|nr:hypothetical protein TeGR_g13401 [Tetraparma gracilis]
MSFWDIDDILSSDLLVPCVAQTDMGLLSDLRGDSTTDAPRAETFRSTVELPGGEVAVVDVARPLFRGEKVALPLWALAPLLASFSPSLPKPYSPSFTSRISPASAHLSLPPRHLTYYASALHLLSLSPLLGRSPSSSRLVSELRSLRSSLQQCYCGERLATSLAHSLSSAETSAHPFRADLDALERECYDAGVAAARALREFDREGLGFARRCGVIGRRKAMRLSVLLLLTATADIASGFGRLPAEPVLDTDYDEEGLQPPECAMHCDASNPWDWESNNDPCAYTVTIYECATESCQDDPAALAKIDEMSEPLLACYCDGQGCEDIEK